MYWGILSPQALLVVLEQVTFKRIIGGTKDLPRPLPRQNTRRDPISNSAPVPGRIEFQRGGERLPDLRGGQQRHPELRPKKAVGGVALPGEGSQEGPAP